MATLNNNVVSINGAEYVTLGEIETVEQPAFTPGFNSLGGQQRFESQQVASSVRFPVPVRGFGRRRITDWNDPEQYQYFWDAVGVDTRWASGISLGIAANAVTYSNTNPIIIRESVLYGAELITLMERHDDGSNFFALASRYASTGTHHAGIGTVLAAGGTGIPSTEPAAKSPLFNI